MMKVFNIVFMLILLNCCYTDQQSKITKHEDVFEEINKVLQD